MKVSRRSHTPSASPAGTSPEPPDEAPPAPSTPATPATPRVPRTRAGAAWVGVCTAALTMIVLIVFMLQNTRSVEVNFLWLHGSLPLSLALLIAAVGAAVVAMVLGTARITQLRRLTRRE